MAFLTADALELVAAAARQSPADEGTVELILCRPEVDGRRVLAEGVLDLEVGLVGDNWKDRPSSSTPDGAPHPLAQITLINSRALAVLAGDESRRALAGDQFHVDFDISVDNVPAGTRLAMGTAVVEVTDKPHTGCQKFAARYGQEAVRFVNSPVGKQLRLRGLNARVVVPGVVRPGDPVAKA